VQALVSPTYLPVPRRLATGVDAARLLQVLAVLERRAGLSFAGHDVHVAVAGGIRVLEPAVDLPLALALASALADKIVPLEIVAYGELGLTGRVRPVPQPVSRAREAVRLGLTNVVGNLPREASGIEGASIHQVDNVGEALRTIL
jgi:DNA repair protein RadA/Sms